MTLFTWPKELIPNQMSMSLTANSKAFESPFNRSVMTHQFVGSRWEATLDFNALDNNSVRELDILKAFLWKLGGINGRFLMWDFSKQGAPARGAPVVNGNDQYGGLLQTRGWTPNQIVIPMGSYFSINNELKIATADIVSNAGGVATLEFAPWLRKTPVDGDAIVTDKPSGIFRLSSNEVVFNIGAGQHGETSISVVEAFNV